MNKLTDFSEKALDYTNRGVRGVLYASFKTIEEFGKKGARSIEKDAEMHRRGNVIKK